MKINPRVLEFSSVNGMHKCLQRGIGVTVCPEASVHDALSKGSFTKLQWQGEAMETSILMIWHAEKWCSPLLRHFMEICEVVIRP